MAKYFDASGALVEYDVPAQIYSLAAKANLSVPSYINREHPTDGKHGTAYDQMLASVGMVTLDADAQRNHGIRPPTVAEIMDGGVSFLAASNTQGVGSPNGQQSRTLFPSAIIAYMEASLVKDYSTDADQFDKLIAQEISVATDTFEQPIVTMSGTGGPQSQRAARRAQLAPPASMLAFTTSDKIRKIPTYALGMEFSKEALRASTLDMVGLSVQRYLSVERDSWVNSYLSDVFAGDLDINTGSLSSLGYNATTVALDSTAVAGTITQKSWLKWLFRNRKYRKIDWVVCDLDSYLKIEGRAGRPGLTAIDLTLPRVESQATVVNSLIGDVKVFIVDSAADGGPIPANTIMGLDSRYGLARVRNTSANVQAAETYALRQAEAFSLQFAEQVYRLNDSAFDTLTIS